DRLAEAFHRVLDLLGALEEESQVVEVLGVVRLQLDRLAHVVDGVRKLPFAGDGQGEIEERLAAVRVGETGLPQLGLRLLEILVLDVGGSEAGTETAV